jgi:hypothetical protein
MTRFCLWFFAPLMILAAANFCQAKGVEITDPAEAKKDPDFLVQGEYLGERAENADSAGKKEKVGAQVIALSKGQFDIVLYEGGLPGEGWRRGDKQSNLQGTTVGKKVLLSGAGMEGTIENGAMTVKNSKGQLALKRIERKSSTLEAKAPAGAKVLFDGKTADNFKDGELTADKNLMSNATSKEKFGDYRLHVEFRLSYMPDARGQARSNSGVYLHDCYEIQVLDSFGLEGKNNECGGFYSIREPNVNMCFPPLVWQTYDFDFTAPKYEKNKKVANAKITVKHNGVVIHDNVELPHATPGREKEGPAPRPFYLQGHGNKVEYRNIWVEEKK